MRSGSDTPLLSSTYISCHECRNKIRIRFSNADLGFYGKRLLSAMASAASIAISTCPVRSCNPFFAVSAKNCSTDVSSSFFIHSPHFKAMLIMRALSIFRMSALFSVQTYLPSLSIEIVRTCSRSAYDVRRDPAWCSRTWTGIGFFICDVISTAIVVGEWVLPLLFWMMATGRTPFCSEPIASVKSQRYTSPRLMFLFIHSPWCKREHHADIVPPCYHFAIIGDFSLLPHPGSFTIAPAIALSFVWMNPLHSEGAGNSLIYKVCPPGKRNISARLRPLCLHRVLSLLEVPSHPSRFDTEVPDIDFHRLRSRLTPFVDRFDRYSHHWEVSANGTRLGATPSMCDVLNAGILFSRCRGVKWLYPPHYSLATTGNAHYQPRENISNL